MKHRRQPSCGTAQSISSENKTIKCPPVANKTTYLNNFVVKWLRWLMVSRVAAREHLIQVGAQSTGDNIH